MPTLHCKWIRFALAVPAGLLSLPALILGAYFLVCCVRIHATEVFYVDYPYALTCCLFLGIGLLSVFLTVLSVRRRSIYGLGFAIPIVLGLATMVYIPDGTPHVQRSMIRDSNLLGSVSSFFRVWYESHGGFPKDEVEFRDALRKGPEAWQNRVKAPSLTSDYAKRGVRLPYEIIVVENASGPRMDSLSDRPGVIYYCVSADQQQFWVTMTGLHDDVSPSATLKRVADRPGMKPWLITATGKDYPVSR